MRPSCFQSALVILGFYLKWSIGHVSGQIENNEDDQTPNVWAQVSADIVSELKTKLIADTCLPGLKVMKKGGDQKLTLFPGKLAGFTSIKQRKDGRHISDVGDNVEFEFRFSFDNLRTEYNYEYLSKFFFLHKTNEGTLHLQLQGVNVFSVVAVAGKASLADPGRRQECYLTVKHMALTQPGDTLKTTKVRAGLFTTIFYFIMKYINPTVRKVTSIISTIEADIKKEIEDALVEAVGKALSESKSVCSVEQTWKPKDCGSGTILLHYP